MTHTRTDTPSLRRARGRWPMVLAMLLAVAAFAAARPGDEAAKKEELRRQSANNLKQLVLAVHNFSDTYNRLPPAAVCDKKTGKPLLSWRVILLPFVEQGPLYKEFKLDEPWDGPNNKKLLEKMPK